MNIVGRIFSDPVRYVSLLTDARISESFVSGLLALAVNSLGGRIIFQMLGVYVDSSPGTLIPALWVHYRCWTSLSLSALWSFIPAPPVG